MAYRVEAQPLLAHAKRVREAMEILGSRLPPEALKLLTAAEQEPDDARVTQMIQRALDPLCIVGVQVGLGKPLAIMDNPAKPALIEQGWRVCLIKVVNDAELTAPLLIESPNARPLPQAPKDEVQARWLDIEPFYARPLTRNLSGLGLEYQVVQVYGRDAGLQTAVFSFNIGDNSKSIASGKSATSAMRHWSFVQGVNEWTALNDCALSVKDGNLEITATGPDPYMAAPVRIIGGDMRVRLRMKIDHDDVAQVFWATADKPDFDGNRQANFSTFNGDWHDYTVAFHTDGDLTRLRLDLSGKPGTVQVSWIEVANADGLETPWINVPVRFRVEPSQITRFRVSDEYGKPTTASFIVRDERGRIYPAQAKRLAPDFAFQQQIYRRNGETIRLPMGRYKVTCSRGPESIPELQTLVIGSKPAVLSYQVKRWIDPSRRGWWSGDHHIHAAGCRHYSNPTEGVLPQDMARHIQGEDLKVGANLTWGPCFDYQKQFFSGKEDSASQYPYLLRYDIEVSGFGSHQSGHLCLLRLKDQMYPGGISIQHWPTLGLNTLRWAKAQGAVCGPAHSANGLTNLTSERVPGPDGPNGLPSYVIPAYDGIGANEYIVDVTHEVPGVDGSPVPAIDFISSMDTDRKAEWNMWYHTLNCGFRTRISGETDFPCISGDRVGLGRVYVKQKGRLTYNDWCEGIHEGRSYVSDGYHHLMDFAAKPLGQAGKSLVLGADNSELKLPQPGRVRLSALVAALNSQTKQVPVEVVMNGYPVARKLVPADGKARQVTFDVNVPYSSWIALRIYPQAHTNPIFIPVANKPIRASRRSAEWCLRGVDQCWSQKQRFYRAEEQTQASQAYDHARHIYARILQECVAN